MVELGSEPLYILAQVRLQLQVRVVAEAAATLVRGVLTLALLKTAACDVGIALSLAQVTSLPVACKSICLLHTSQPLRSCNVETASARMITVCRSGLVSKCNIMQALAQHVRELKRFCE